MWWPSKVVCAVGYLLDNFDKDGYSFHLETVGSQDKDVEQSVHPCLL